MSENSANYDVYPWSNNSDNNPNDDDNNNTKNDNVIVASGRRCNNDVMYSSIKRVERSSRGNNIVEDIKELLHAARENDVT